MQLRARLLLLSLEGVRFWAELRACGPIGRLRPGFLVGLTARVTADACGRCVRRFCAEC